MGKETARDVGKLQRAFLLLMQEHPHTEGYDAAARAPDRPPQRGFVAFLKAIMGASSRV